MKKWTENEKNEKIKSKTKEKKKREKKSRNKGKQRAQRGTYPPEMGPKIDFSHQNCQEKS